MPEAHLINGHSLVFPRQSAQVLSLPCSLALDPIAEQIPSVPRLSPGPSPRALL